LLESGRPQRSQREVKEDFVLTNEDNESLIMLPASVMSWSFQDTEPESIPQT